MLLRCVDTLKGGRETLEEHRGHVEVWRAHPSSRVGKRFQGWGRAHGESLVPRWQEMEVDPGKLGLCSPPLIFFSISVPSNKPT